MTGTYRYVEYTRVPAFVSEGWMFERPLNPYRALMRACDCNPEGSEPKEPADASR